MKVVEQALDKLETAKSAIETVHADILGVSPSVATEFKHYVNEIISYVERVKQFAKDYAGSEE